METEEIWRPIEITSGNYEVSNLGRVRSLFVANHHGEFRRKNPLIMSPYDNGGGYLVVNLRIDGEYKCKCVSDLVLTAFTGPRPDEGYQAAHLDGVKAHNYPENLQWCTATENAGHRKIHGTQRYRESRTVDGTTQFQCTHCKEWFPREGFYVLRSSNSSCGINSWCRKCMNRERTERRREQAAARDSQPSTPLPDPTSDKVTPYNPVYVKLSDGGLFQRLITSEDSSRGVVSRDSEAEAATPAVDISPPLATETLPTEPIESIVPGPLPPVVQVDIDREEESRTIDAKLVLVKGFAKSINQIVGALFDTHGVRIGIKTGIDRRPNGDIETLRLELVQDL